MTTSCRVLPGPGMVAFGIGVAVCAAMRPVGVPLLAGVTACCSAALFLAVWHRRFLGGWAVVDAAVVAAMGFAAAAHRGGWTRGGVESRLSATTVLCAVLLAAAATVAIVARAVTAGVGRRGEEGLATVEFVVLIPVLLAVVGLAVIGGRITTAEGEVQGAARAAARAASLQRDPLDAQAAADQAAQADLQAAGVNCAGYTLQLAAGPPGGVDRATLSCVVPLGGVEWMNVSASKTIVMSSSSPVDAYRQGT